MGNCEDVGARWNPLEPAGTRWKMLEPRRSPRVLLHYPNGSATCGVGARWNLVGARYHTYLDDVGTRWNPLEPVSASARFCYRTKRQREWERWNPQEPAWNPPPKAPQA